MDSEHHIKTLGRSKQVPLDWEAREGFLQMVVTLRGTKPFAARGPLSLSYS